MGRPKIDNAKSKRLTIRFDEETYSLIKEICKKQNLSQAELFRLALTQFCKKNELIACLPNKNTINS